MDQQLPRWTSVQSAIQFLYRVLDHNIEFIREMASTDQMRFLSERMSRIQTLLSLHSLSALSKCTALSSQVSANEEVENAENIDEVKGSLDAGESKRNPYADYANIIAAYGQACCAPTCLVN